MFPIRLRSRSRNKAASSQDGCVNYSMKQTIAGKWHIPSNTGMTYPKSEIRIKNCEPFTFRGTGRRWLGGSDRVA